jgi:hypothetical protein
MRLLNTSTIELEEFFSDHVPKYAILSHRWESEEVTYQVMCSGTAFYLTKGYSKITGCCALAAKDGWQYGWVDSCCIDKSSSAELSEAINSMFKWYRNAEVCYVYLSDVKNVSQSPSWPEESGFCRSQWFTRGWTLQELLAPAKVNFYDREWSILGTKVGLENLLENTTGIKDLCGFETACVARKMSWAAKRETTRIEDKAYCLIGLFGVNLPPLYGEGEKTFFRLELEIMNKLDDESIFAWTEELDRQARTGLLASSPLAFRKCGDLELGVISKIFDIERLPYSMTNKGLSMEHFFVVFSNSDLNDSLSLLNCKREGTAEYLAIYITPDGTNEHSRGYANELFVLNLNKEKVQVKRKTFFIKQQFLIPGLFHRERLLFSFGWDKFAGGL